MKIAIIAFCLSLVALGFGIFATVDTLRSDDARTLYVPVAGTPLPSETWTAERCWEFAGVIDTLEIGCLRENGNGCAAYAQAVSDRAENCGAPTPAPTPFELKRFQPPTATP